MRLKNKLFFGKDLAEWKIVSTFALAFEKSSITRSNIKKEFFERFYINRQVVQEAVLDYTLIIYREYEETG